jgi:putative ABC transport system permease protein
LLKNRGFTTVVWLTLPPASGRMQPIQGCKCLAPISSGGVARRTREIGIRMALGAQIADVLGLILSQGLALVAVGGVIGITVALATGRVLRASLFGVRRTDSATFIAVVLSLAAVALFACWLPARRALKVDPREALRYE